jgi:hypothetical protein
MGKRQPYTEGETVDSTIQKHRIHKIENKYAEQEHKHKNNIKNVSPVIRRCIEVNNNHTTYCIERTYSYITGNQ